MHGYLVEGYGRRSTAESVGAVEARARAAARLMRREGLDVRFVRSVFVPSDETWFHLFVAPDEAAAIEASRRAELRVDRVVAAAL